MLALERLSTSEMRESCAPWEWTGDFASIPAECLVNKRARDKWANDPATHWHFWCPYVAVNPRLRISGDDAAEDSNPPLEQWCFAIDCDIQMTPEEAMKYAGSMKKPPMWFEWTLSNHGRFVWPFEAPIKHPCRAFVKLMHERLGEFLELNMLPGIDKPALITPSRIFTNGARWTKLSDYQIPQAELIGFSLKIVEKFNFVRKELGKASDIRKVAAECAKRYPRFAEWPGEFAEGTQGPSFWLPDSVSPKSAIVKANGIYTFSASATKSFYGWAELVGAQFVEQTENNKMGGAVRDIYYDGQRYFYKDMAGRWQDSVQDHVRRYLSVEHRLSTRATKTEPSEVDSALNYISMHNRISCAQSFAFYPKGIFNYQGETVLNLHSRDVVKHTDTIPAWGSEGKFPRLSYFLDNAFTSPEQLHYLLARWKKLYRGCLTRKPEQGQGVIFCGPPGKGKTFLLRALIGYSVGGFAEAGAYLTRADGFNSELFHVAVWVVDDGTSLSSDNIHRIFSESVKKGIANPEHRLNEKFRKASMVRWEHLIGITCNDDPESLRGIPNIDLSSKEKLLIFRMNPNSPFVFEEKNVMSEIVEREMPHFLAWLLQYNPPDYVVKGAEPRWGINNYCEPSLARAANQSAPVNGFFELLTKWLREHYFEANGDASFWEGTSTDLRVAMSTDFVFAELLRPFQANHIGRFLAQIQSKSLLKITITDSEHERIWRIERDDRFKRRPTAPTPPVSTKFEKTQ